jgi:hypothetical protein
LSKGHKTRDKRLSEVYGEIYKAMKKLKGDDIFFVGANLFLDALKYLHDQGEDDDVLGLLRLFTEGLEHFRIYPMHRETRIGYL